MQTDFGIVVALQKELDAVKEALHESEELSIPGTLPFLRGTLAGFTVVVRRCSQQGSVCSALAASDLVREFRPQHLVLLGIAAGFPDEVSLGDVVIADPVFGYEYSKVYDEFSEHEPRTFRAYQRPLLEFQHQNPLLKDIPDKPPSDGTTRIRFGPLASGSKLVASKIFREKLTVPNRKVCSLEMEAEGVAQAALHFGLGFLVIKGISDFAERATKGRRGTPKKRELHHAWQKYAARASVQAFAQLLEHCRTKSIFSTATNGKAADPPHVLNFPRRPSHEEDFLSMARELSPLKLGGLNLNCKLFPPELWWVRDRRQHLYFDERERGKQIELEWVDDARLPENTLEKLVYELQRAIDDPATGQPPLSGPV